MMPLKVLPTFLALWACVSALPAPGKGFFERECQGNSTCERVFAREAVGLLQYWSARSSPYVDPYVAKEELESSSFLLVPSLLAASSDLLVPLQSFPACAPSSAKACLSCLSEQHRDAPLHGLFLVVGDESRSGALTSQVVAAEKDGGEWLQASRNAAQVLGEKIIGLVRDAGDMLQRSLGNFTYKITLDVGGELFPEGGPLTNVSAVHFVHESTLVLNPRIAQKIANYVSKPSYMDALQNAYGELKVALSRAHLEGDPKDGNEASTKLVKLHSKLALQRVERIKELAAYPWKCLVCIVTMGTLVPLAVNVALQALGVAYCDKKGLTPDQCVNIRYLMLGLGVVLMPLEVIPIAAICMTQGNCKTEPLI